MSDEQGSSNPAHVTVMPGEVVEHLGGLSGAVVDCTLGLGGHSEALLRASQKLTIIGLDVDPANIETARTRLAPFVGRVQLLQANFADLRRVLADLNPGPVAGILADLGVSSNQIADPARGLSFDLEGPLDMRLDPRQKTTAADLVNTLGEGELSDLLYFQSQERHSRKIAKRICAARRQGRINSTVMLARLVAAAIGENPEGHPGRIHPATRTFMALRIAVNREGQSLTSLLADAREMLMPGGRIAVISFHSGEDRLVKIDFKARESAGEYRILTKKPLVPGDDEMAANPRSRSAKFRVAEKC
ncbi:MAG: 16S rRNA (cytosine(1402)-N(4))-methyltransferase RsmH [Planctomycetes bacterium]|nr:16S rRNA (cytosine(1402)-N(4))-methyltransferase RsmH [Planctomycetota bacterium]